MAASIKLDINSTQEAYTNLFGSPVGTIVNVLNYETVFRRIEEYKPAGLEFELYPITPGTDLFTIYGCDHAIISVNRVV